MRPVRVYLPLSKDDLEMLIESRSLPMVPAAFAVTAAVEREDPDGDEDTWEWRAMSDAAAAASAARVGDRPRVIASADLPTDAVGGLAVPPAQTPTPASRVTVSGGLPLRSVACVHVDEDGAAPSDADLMWFDVSELREVLDRL